MRIVPELELAIKTVCRGETYLTPAMAKFTLDAYCRQDDVPMSPAEQTHGAAT